MSKQGREMYGKSESDGQHTNRRLELNVPQVAGSALAAVAAAVLASKLGVYGTIIGAGVVSVVATAGGTVFQHLFRRTGEQIKEVRVQTRPKGRGRRGAAAPAPGAEPVAPGEYGEPTTHGTRLRGAKRPILGALAVFAVAMSAITGIEWFSGGPVSNVWGGDGGGTTVSESVTGSSGSSGSKPAPASSRRDSTTPSPDSSRNGDAPASRTSRGGGASGTATPTPSPSGSSGTGTGSGGGSGATDRSTPGTSAPATPAPSWTPSGGATDSGTDGTGSTTPQPDVTAGQ
ncbi:hypothetical protein [Streptomyces sp. NPDC005336]|uniref:hypothetical protein n=1 Tax=Streptomyces sp. NPDC005336 TaxID=3157035 RepID=UPI0033BF4F80